MIDGTQNEMGGAFAELVYGRGELTPEQALAVMVAYEQTDRFWNQCDDIVDAALAHYDALAKP